FSLDFGARADATAAVGKALFVVEKASADALRLTWADGSIAVTKELSLGADYLCQGKVSVVGPAYAIVVGPGLRNTTEQERASSYVQPPTAIAAVGNGIERMRADKAEKIAADARKAGREAYAEWQVAPGAFAGLEDNYFLTVLVPKKTAMARIVPFNHKDVA